MSQDVCRALQIEIGPCETSRLELTCLSTTKIDYINRTWYADDSGLKRTLLLNLAQVNISEDKRKIGHFVSQISQDITLSTLHSLHDVSSCSDRYSWPTAETHHAILSVKKKTKKTEHAEKFQNPQTIAGKHNVVNTGPSVIWLSFYFMGCVSWLACYCDKIYSRHRFVLVPEFFFFSATEVKRRPDSCSSEKQRKLLELGKIIGHYSEEHSSATRPG